MGIVRKPPIFGLCVGAMAVEPIYTLEELAENTGRPASFWAGECDSGRLACLRPDPGGQEVLILASDFKAWVTETRTDAEHPPDNPSVSSQVPSAAYLTKAEQEALAPVP